MMDEVAEVEIAGLDSEILGFFGGLENDGLENGWLEFDRLEKDGLQIVK